MSRPKGRPNQGKTETIRARTVRVYLPSEELVNNWKSAAKESDLSLSQFILEAVERQRAHGTGPYLPKLELEKSLGETQEELSQLKSKHEILEAAYQKRDLDAKQHSKQLEKLKKGPDYLEMTAEMVKNFKSSPETGLNIFDLLERLGIEDDDTDKARQFREASDLLNGLGLVQSSGFGSRVWMGDRIVGQTKKSPRRKPRYARKVHIIR